MGGLFSPGLLDDVDSVYLEVAREMLRRHDFVTPTIDGLRFFDKPPLMYWLAAGSMHLFGAHDWAGRLPIALAVLLLLLATYALGNRLFGHLSPINHPDRGGLYAALAMATSVGPYLYTRFFIPDILIVLWMILAVHLLLFAVGQASHDRSAGWPMLGFGAVLALNLLTKGLIGVIFPVAFAGLYLALTRQLTLLRRLHLPAAAAVFLVVAAPWHILAALRNPAIAMPPGTGLPAHAGWAWFYLYNEHVARFLGQRIPHDYGQVPIPLFWLLLFLWLFPWVAFLPPALLNGVRFLRAACTRRHDLAARLRARALLAAGLPQGACAGRSEEAALALLLWPAIVLGFFTVSSRQEYYHLPALPALALLVGGMLASADRQLQPVGAPGPTGPWAGAPDLLRQARRCSLFLLVPLGAVLSALCGYWALTAPAPAQGATLHGLLASNPAFYNLSLGHMFDLTGPAMGFFRGPLLAVSVGALLLGPGSHLLRRARHTFAANLLIAASMTLILLAAHQGLVRFYPILGSKDLALAIDAQRAPGDLLMIDGELTSGSSLLFYTGQPAILVNGRVNGPWFGSFWPDAPHVFASDDRLDSLWAGPRRVFLLTYDPVHRAPELSHFGPVHQLAASGGKAVLTNR